MASVYSALEEKGRQETVPRSGTTAEPAVLLSIQALRAVAALAVVAYHALQWASGGFDVGRAGVDVFFVVSGFVMWHVTAGREVAPAEFLWRRFTRVAPPYWIVTLAVLIAALAWPDFLPEVRPGWSHLGLSLAFVPHLDPRGLPFPTLPPGWSLNYEAVFYLMFAAALAGPRRWRGRVVLSGLTALTALGFLFPEPFYTLLANPMLLQFAAGMGLGVAAEHRRLPSIAVGWAMIGIALVIWAVERPLGVFTELWRPLLWGVPAWLTVTGAIAIEAGGGLARLPSRIARGLKTLGDASYATYLVHLPATALVAHTLGWAHPRVFLAVSLFVSAAAGMAFHARVERPLLSLSRRAVRAT